MLIYDTIQFQMSINEQKTNLCLLLCLILWQISSFRILQLCDKVSLTEKFELTLCWVGMDIICNNSLAAKGAHAHRLQRHNIRKNKKISARRDRNDQWGPEWCPTLGYWALRATFVKISFLIRAVVL